MTLRSSLSIFLLAFCLLTILSCKKKGDQLPDPTPTVNPLELGYQRSDPHNEAVLDMSAAASENHLYISGGTNFGGATNLLIYTPNTSQWAEFQLSKKRASTNVRYFKGKVFVSGGDIYTAEQCRIDIYDENTKTSTFKLFGDMQSSHTTASAIVEDRYVVFYDYNYLYVYDSTSGNWETIDNPLPTRISAVSMVGIGSKLYFIDVHNLKNIKVFDFKSRAWSAIPSLHHPENTKFLALDDRIYFYGNASFNALNQIDVFDVKTGVWSNINLPSERMLYEMTIDPKSKSLVITGGITNQIDAAGNTGGIMSNDLLIYNIEHKNWQKQKLKYARYRHVGQFVGNNFIVYGGSSAFYEVPLIKLPTEFYLVNH